MGHPVGGGGTIQSTNVLLHVFSHFSLASIVLVLSLHQESDLRSSSVQPPASRVTLGVLPNFSLPETPCPSGKWKFNKFVVQIKWGLECKAVSTAQKMWGVMISLWLASVVGFQLFNVGFYKEAFIMVLRPSFSQCHKRWRHAPILEQWLGFGSLAANWQTIGNSLF